MALVAVLSFIKDTIKLSTTDSLIIVIVITILSFLSSLPWSDISIMFSLKPGKMNATLSLE